MAGGHDQAATERLSQSRVTAWALFTGTLSLVVLALILALVTRLPDQTSGTVLAVFPPRSSQDRVFEAVAATEARIIRATLFSNAWIIESTTPDFVAKLKQAGALGAWKPVSGVSFAVGGCGFGAILSNDPELTGASRSSSPAAAAAAAAASAPS